VMMMCGFLVLIGGLVFWIAAVERVLFLVHNPLPALVLDMD
jgi:hypothetical protein